MMVEIEVHCRDPEKQRKQRKQRKAKKSKEKQRKAKKSKEKQRKKIKNGSDEETRSTRVAVADRMRLA